jgi:hypothetical protein
MAVIRPLGTSNVMSSSTVCDPNDSVTPSNEMMGSPGAIHARVSHCGSDAMKEEPAIMGNLAPRAHDEPFVLRVIRGPRAGARRAQSAT